MVCGVFGAWSLNTKRRKESLLPSFYDYISCPKFIQKGHLPHLLGFLADTTAPRGLEPVSSRPRPQLIYLQPRVASFGKPGSGTVMMLDDSSGALLATPPSFQSREHTCFDNKRGPHYPLGRIIFLLKAAGLTLLLYYVYDDSPVLRGTIRVDSIWEG